MAERRPYLGLKDSQLTFFQEQTRSLQESAVEESEFEKPYRDKVDYRKMHFNPSEPTWTKPTPGPAEEPHEYPPLCCYTTGKIIGVLEGYDNGVLTAPDYFDDYIGTRYLVLVSTFWGPKSMVCCSSDFVNYLVGDVVLLLLLGFWAGTSGAYTLTEGFCFTDCPEGNANWWCQEGSHGKSRPDKADYGGASSVDGCYLIVPLAHKWFTRGRHLEGF